MSNIGSTGDSDPVNNPSMAGGDDDGDFDTTSNKAGEVFQRVVPGQNSAVTSFASRSAKPTPGKPASRIVKRAPGKRTTYTQEELVALDKASEAASSEASEELNARKSLDSLEQSAALYEVIKIPESIKNSQASLKEAAYTTAELHIALHQLNQSQGGQNTEIIQLRNQSEDLLKLLSTDLQNVGSCALQENLSKALSSFRNMLAIFSQKTPTPLNHKHISPTLNENGVPFEVSQKSLSKLVEEWDRAILKSTLRDCPPMPPSLIDAKKQKPDASMEALQATGQTLFNRVASVTSSIDLPSPVDLGVNPYLSDIGYPRTHQISALFFSMSGTPIGVKFHAAEIASQTITPFLPLGNEDIDPQTLTAFANGELPEIKLDSNVNCLAFACGYRSQKGVLEPGAPIGAGTHPVAWVADSILRQQGCIRIDSMISSFDFRLLRNNVANPYYLIAVIHTGGNPGLPDAHVMRCFFHPNQGPNQSSLVWLESGGEKFLRFVVDQENKPIRGIPNHPQDSFLKAKNKEGYSCFLGYYLVSDRMRLHSRDGTQAKRLKYQPFEE